MADEDADVPDRIERTERVYHRCVQCGKLHHSNSPPCKNCGAMVLQAVSGDAVGDIEDDYEAPGPNRQLSVASIFTYVVAIGLGYAAVRLFPGAPLSASFLLLGIPLTVPQLRTWLCDALDLDVTPGAAAIIVVGCLFAALYVL